MIKSVPVPSAHTLNVPRRESESERMTLLPLWFKGLTPELQKRAETTLGETSHAKAKALVDFRRLINEQGDIYSRLDEVFLLRFLRTKKYDVQKAFRVYRNYYHFQSKQRGKFTGFRPSDVKRVIDMNNILYVPYRVPPGSHVAIFRMGSFDVSKATAQDLVATVFMIGEMILDTEATQICGGIIIIDAEGLTLQHYRQFVNLQFLTLILNLIQKHLIPVLNCNRDITAIIATLRTGHLKGMKVMPDGSKTYKHCPGTQLDPEHLLNCRAIAAALFKIDPNYTRGNL